MCYGVSTKARQLETEEALLEALSIPESVTVIEVRPLVAQVGGTMLEEAARGPPAEDDDLAVRRAHAALVDVRRTLNDVIFYTAVRGRGGGGGAAVAGAAVSCFWRRYCVFMFFSSRPVDDDDEEEEEGGGGGC